MKLFARDPYRKITVARRVIVNLTDGETAISGYVTDTTRELVVLRGAELLTEGAEPLSISGETVIERTKISFIQVPPGSKE